MLVLIAVVLVVTTVTTLALAIKKGRNTELDHTVSELESARSAARASLEDYGNRKLALSGDRSSNFFTADTLEYAAFATTGQVAPHSTQDQAFSEATRTWIRGGSPSPHSTMGAVLIELLLAHDGDIAQEARSYFEPHNEHDDQLSRAASAAVANYTDMTHKLEDLNDTITDLATIAENSPTPEAVQDLLSTPVLDYYTGETTAESLALIQKHTQD